MKRIFSLLLIIFLISPPVYSETPIIPPRSVFEPVKSKNGMVVTQERFATHAGLQVLREGGNAIDAAVTIGFVLAVTLPRAGNLGGGGFMLINLKRYREVVAIDYREKAPLRATRDMFLDEAGNADPQKSRNSLQAVGVPGTVAGLTLAFKKYGTISLERAIRPALHLARDGFPVYEDLENSLRKSKSRFEKSPDAFKTFYKPDGEPYRTGEVLKQPDLANTLDQIMKRGASAFYRGSIAKKIVAYMKENGGLITSQDLKKYKAKIREPARGTYRNFDIYSMPPPSSGGIHIIQMLNLLEPHDLKKLGHNTVQTIHLMTEAMKLAYADRSKYLGDSDFISVPSEGLISKKYATKLQEKLNFDRATSSIDIQPGDPLPFESNETTHFSVIDKDGNAVSNTYTLNFSYGNKMMVPGTGILLNNEMDDFSAKPGVPNAYGLIGGEANAIQPEKRMLSSMSPTIVKKNDRAFLVTGSPGGSRIITTVLQIILNVIDHEMNIQEATNAPRIHHQWWPNELRLERGINQDVIKFLEMKRHRVKMRDPMGAAQSIVWDGTFFYGAADPRRGSSEAVGY